MDFKKRCADCACLIEKNGKWCCDECFGQPCAEIDDCPLGVSENTMTEIDEKMKGYKVDHGATAAERKKSDKPRTVKISDEKKELFQLILSNLTGNNVDFIENVEVLKENKLIFVKIGEKNFKIDIIEQRKPKK